MTKTDSSSSVTYKAAKSTCAVFAVLFGAVAAIGVAASIKSNHWQPAAFCSLPLMFGIVWLSRYRLEIGETYIVYRGWKSNGRAELADISEVEFAGMPLHDREIPSSICVLRSRTGAVIRINPKVFSREAAMKVVRIARGIDSTRD